MRHIKWYRKWDSNPQNERFELSTYASSIIAALKILTISMHPIARVAFSFRCALCDRTLTCTASGYSMAPPLKDGIWLTITPHKAVVETLSTLGLTPNLHRHDDEKQDTIYLPNALSS